MRPLKRADLINGSLIFVLAIQSATLLFSVAHRAFDMPLSTSRGMLGVEIPWLFVGLETIVTVIVAALIGRHAVRTWGAEATTEPAISAKAWFVSYGVMTGLLTIYYFHTFAPVFRP